MRETVCLGLLLGYTKRQQLCFLSVSFLHWTYQGLSRSAATPWAHPPALHCSVRNWNKSKLFLETNGSGLSHGNGVTPKVRCCSYMWILHKTLLNHAAVPQKPIQGDSANLCAISLFSNTKHDQFMRSCSTKWAPLLLARINVGNTAINLNRSLHPSEPSWVSCIDCIGLDI